MTTITTRTGTISSAGVGSGLDVAGIVTSLLEVEKQPLNRLQSAATTLQTKISAFGQMQSIAAALQDAARPLYSAGTYTATKTVSSDGSAVSASTGANAAPGAYSVQVTALAAGQSVVSAAGQFVDGSSVVGTGGLTIRLGAWNVDHTVFTAKAGSADIVVPIGASENTLAGIRDKVNAANAGVTATIVTDANGARLSLQSSATGASNGFRVSVFDDDASHGDATGLSRLAYDPQGGAAQMTRAQSAADAQATINGISISSSGNTLANVIDGITFTLAKTTTQPVAVNVTRDTDAIKGKLAAFVAAYNTLESFLSTVTHYDAATKQSALLQGDGTTTGIQNQLHTLVGRSSPASATFKTLSSMGVQLQKDGSLKLDDAAFSTAVANLPELTKALSNVDAGQPGNDGIGKRFAAWADKLLASNGSIPGKTTALQAQLTANQKSQSAMNDRLAATEARLRAQYNTLDTTMSRANALAKYVQQQFYNIKQSSFSGDD